MSLLIVPVYGDKLHAQLWPFKSADPVNPFFLFARAVFALINVYIHRTSRNSDAPAAHPATPAAAVAEIAASTPGSKPGLHSGSAEGDRTAENHSGDCLRNKCRNGRDGIDIAHSRDRHGVNGEASAVDGSIIWWWLASVVCSFLASGVLHEAVAFIAMRRTFWPFNTLFLALSASMTPCWELLFPVLRPPAERASTFKGIGNVAAVKPAALTKPVAATTTPAAATLDAGESCAVPKVPSNTIGRWRGWTAVVVYMVASVPLTLSVDYLVWQWWRHAVMEE